MSPTCRGQRAILIDTSSHSSDQFSLGSGRGSSGFKFTGQRINSTNGLIIFYMMAAQINICIMALVFRHRTVTTQLLFSLGWVEVRMPPGSIRVGETRRNVY